MLRVSNKENQPEHIQAAYVYHPQSAALEKKVKELVAGQFALFGLKLEDYHEIRNDIEFVRELRHSRKRTLAFTAKVIWLSFLTVIGALLTAGFYAVINRGQP